MTKLKNIILYTMLLITLFNFGFIYSQQSEKVTINGFIYDSKTGEALIGANAHIEGSNLGATSNLSGFFAIPGVTIGKHTLIVSFMGYKNQAVNLNVKKSSSEVIKVMLQENVVETQEIVIKGDSVRTIDKLFIKPVSRVELNATQINNIPRVIEADLLRSLQTIPGIQPLSDFSSSLYVRGGTPDQNLYLIDGTDVYNPEHAFGLFSTFNTSAIKKVELSKGGFSAEYGGRLSSILNVTNLDGNRYNFKGEANISLIAASATLQA
ncbi:MAG: TonB-dependent receptor, partial [Bacteroidota bacterium]|nr:TonB-dependent receptor [Bacteroidota bacterium]